MRKVLIAGGSSFVGSNLIKFLNRYRPGYSIINYDRDDGGTNRDLPPSEAESKYAFLPGDLTDRQRVWHSTILCDLVINLVWTDEGSDPIGSNAYAETTFLGASNLIQSSVIRGVSRFLQLSTTDVYADRSSESAPATESEALAPISVSAATRAGVELLVHGYHKQHELGALTVRVSNVYGPNMSRHELLPQLIKAMASGKPAPQGLDAKFIRDWIHVDDVCTAIDEVLHTGEIGEVFNICSGEHITDSQLVRSVAHAAQSTPVGRWIDAKATSGSLASNKKLRALGWEPKRTFESSLPELLEEYST